ncbi:MAG TPA: hypothetical protein PKD61_38905, partial [Polyangiaceae bacterium]|nr:hypothetical protein [Polyangiaceae bacterium]
MLRRASLSVFVFAATTAVSAATTASPAELYGFGPQPQAMAGAGAAVARGFATTYANPALLALSRDRQLSLGYQAAPLAL